MAAMKISLDRDLVYIPPYMYVRTPPETTTACWTCAFSAGSCPPWLLKECRIKYSETHCLGHFVRIQEGAL